MVIKRCLEIIETKILRSSIKIYIYRQMTAFTKKMEESNPYYDYAFKWINFAIKYNSALLDASSKAFETFLSARKGTAQNIEKTIKSSFDTTLRDNLNDDALASSMADYIDSSFGYKQITANFYDVFSYATDALNRSETTSTERHPRSLR